MNSTAAQPCDTRPMADTIRALTLRAVSTRNDTIVTRKASQNVIAASASVLPDVVGGSADLASSNLTLRTGARDVAMPGGGDDIRDSVRGFGIAAVQTGGVAGIDPFGESAPPEVLFEHFGLTVPRLVKAAAALVKKGRAA